jgi:hypothetical protein
MREELARRVERLALRAGLLETTVERITDHEALVARLHATEGEGWVCCVSHTPVRWRFGDALPASRLLSAEVHHGDRSVHIRHHGDHWSWTSLFARPEGDQRWSDVEFLSTVDGAHPPRMRYERWYRREALDGVSVWVPFAARFIGWSE